MEKIQCPGSVVSGLIELITVGLTHDKIQDAAAVWPQSEYCGQS